MMSEEEALSILLEFNLWRRGHTEGPQPSPKQAGIAIEIACLALAEKIAEAKNEQPDTDA